MQCILNIFASFDAPCPLSTIPSLPTYSDVTLFLLSPWRPVCVALLALRLGPALTCSQSTGTYIKQTSPNSYQMLIAPQLTVTLHICHPRSIGQVLFVLSSSLWVHMCACSVVSAKHGFIEITYLSYSLSSPLSFPSFLPPLPQRSLGTGVRGGFNLFLNYSSHPPKKRANFSTSSASQDKNIHLTLLIFQVEFLL